MSLSWQDFILQWFDLIWLPIGWFVVHKPHRLKTMAFIITCLLTLRTQVELMGSIDHPFGFTGLMHSDALTRGMIVYSVIIALFLLLAFFSPNTKPIVFFSVSLTIYVLAFCVSMGVMLI
jgi:hypothetical protein